MTDTTKALEVLHATVGQPTGALEKDVSRWVPGYWNDLSDWLGWIGAGTETLTLIEAIQIGAVLACVDVIAQDVARAPLRLKHRLRNGGSEVVEPRQHWLAEMLAVEPNRWQTWQEWKEMVATHLILSSNAFIVKRMRNDGIVTELLPVPPSNINAHTYVDGGGIAYSLQLGAEFDQVLFRGIRWWLTEEEVIHVRGRVFDGFWGLSTLWAGSAALRFARAVTDYQTRMYENDAQVRGVFEMKEGKEILTDEAFMRLRRQLGEQMEKFRRLAQPIILEDGLTFKSVSMTADQAEVSKAHEQSLAAVARLFRLPSHKIGATDNVKYDNYEPMERAYIAGTLQPRWIEIEERLNRGLLSREERVDYYLDFDRSAVELADVQKQQERVFGLVDRGAITIDEARMKLGMNPLPQKAGEVRMVPGNMTMVDMDNEVVFRAGGNAPTDGAGAAGAGSGPGKPSGTPAPAEKGAIIHLEHRERA